MIYTLQMTLMGMGVAIIAIQLRGELLGFITRYGQRMKLNALVFSIVFIIVSILSTASVGDGLVNCRDSSKFRCTMLSVCMHLAWFLPSRFILCFWQDARTKSSALGHRLTSAFYRLVSFIGEFTTVLYTTLYIVP